ncbi:ADP-forming succinate--CoA ligase subunit beta [Thermodesulfobacteriota bacterium]
MNLYEFQAKGIFKEYGIKIPQSQLVCNPTDAVNASKEIGLPVVIKSQILEGGRGKAGLIRIVRQDSEVRKHAEDLLFNTGRTKNERHILVEKHIGAKREYYMGITIDELTEQPVLVFGTAGGVDIEEISKRNPETLFRLSIDPWEGVYDTRIESFVRELTIHKGVGKKLRPICKRMIQLFLDKDCLLAEINPLVASEEGDLVALDAKVVFDDNALFRHPAFRVMEGESSDVPLENEANKRGFSYVKLDGDIGIISHGAGLGMLAVDMIGNAGGSAANFLDIKGHEREKNKVQETRVRNEMDLVYSDTRIKAILFNVFGGLTRCDEVAEEIRNYLREHESRVPVVVRLSGTGSEKVHEILKDENVFLVDSLDAAISEVVRLSKRNKNRDN